MSDETSEYSQGEGRLRDHAARGAAWSVLAQTSIRISGLVTFVILARLLAPEDFGAIALASTLALALTVVADFGFGAYLVHLDRADQRTLSTAFWLNAFAGLLLAGSLIALSWPLSELVRAPQAAPVIAAVSLAVVLDSLRGVSAALLRRRFDFKALALRMLAATTVGQLVAVALAFAGAGVWALVGQVWTANLVATIWVWRAARWHPSLHFSRAAARDMGTYGMHVVSATLIIQASAWVTNGLVSRYLGLQQLGYYAMAMRVMTMVVDSAHQAAGQFATPMLASVKGQRDRLVPAYLSGQTLITAVGVPVLAVLAINADLLVPTVLGAKWAAAVPAFQFLAIAGMGRVVGWTINAQLLVAIGQVRVNNVLSVTSSLLLVGGAFLGAQVSLTAVAAATAAISVGFVPVVLLAVSRALLVSPAVTFLRVGRVVGVAGVAALPAYGATVMLTERAPSLLAAAVSIATYAGVHLALLRLIEPQLWRTGAGMVGSLLSGRRPKPGKPAHRV